MHGLIVVVDHPYPSLISSVWASHSPFDKQLRNVIFEADLVYLDELGSEGCDQDIYKRFPSFIRMMVLDLTVMSARGPFQRI